MNDTSRNSSQVFYYDADCRLCTRLVGWLGKADLFRRITWTPYQSLEAPPPGLSWDDLQRAAYLVDGDTGRLYEGFYAFRMLTVRLPVLAPLAPICWFPAMGLLGTAVYRWVARNRHRLSGCTVPGLGRRGRNKGP
ncbi:MAG: DUF393 domain-containing protein [Chloroflexi bacterium]|nr:DUF393 domain-containing protein [Chloroflexota bacterium]MDA1270335.1 DUF393 domain-containing protein [Chloroflexota bacterium]